MVITLWNWRVVTVVIDRILCDWRESIFFSVSVKTFYSNRWNFFIFRGMKLVVNNMSIKSLLILTCNLHSEIRVGCQTWRCCIYSNTYCWSFMCVFGCWPLSYRLNIPYCVWKIYRMLAPRLMMILRRVTWKYDLLNIDSSLFWLKLALVVNFVRYHIWVWHIIILHSLLLDYRRESVCFVIFYFLSTDYYPMSVLVIVFNEWHFIILILQEFKLVSNHVRLFFLWLVHVCYTIYMSMWCLSSVECNFFYRRCLPEILQLITLFFVWISI